LLFCGAEVQALEPDIRSDFFEMFLSQSADSLQSSPGEAHPGLDTLYIGVVCTRDVKTLEFAFTGTYEVLEIIPQPGVENLGTTQEPYLVASGYLYPLIGQVYPTATVIVEDVKGLGAELCFGETSSNDRMCFQISDRDTWYQVESWYGFTTIDQSPCYGYGDSAGCTSIAIDSNSWGEVKARYR
jgi:hypothetical protein